MSCYNQVKDTKLKANHTTNFRPIADSGVMVPLVAV